MPEPAWFQQALATVGYRVPDTGVIDEASRGVVAAFQMKYRPARYDGTPDAETAALLQVLNNTEMPAGDPVGDPVVDPVGDPDRGPSGTAS